MAVLYGKIYTKQELLSRVGDIAQIAGAERCVLQSGRAGGCEAVYVKTGGGLTLTLLPGRGMDIAEASCNGFAVGYLSKTGLVGPAYCETEGAHGFLRGFYAGLLTTCGLNNAGVACVDEGRAYGLHDRIHAAPAEDVCVFSRWEGDDYVFAVSGRMRQAQVFSEYLTLTRTYTFALGENRVRWKDQVQNCGFAPAPLMLLYHINFGFPLLNEDARLILPPHRTVARDAEAEKGIGCYDTFSCPQPGYKEQVFFHEPEPNADGRVTVQLLSGRPGLKGVVLRYHKNQLPCLTQWKQVGQGDYVVGLEPGTCTPIGRVQAKEEGRLSILEPFETREFELELEIL